jgi:hypothetical protein
VETLHLTDERQIFLKQHLKTCGKTVFPLPVIIFVYLDILLVTCAMW